MSFIDNGDLDFWFKTTKRQQSDALSPEVKTLVLDGGSWRLPYFLIEKRFAKKD
jgi:hypothetical protein